MIRALYDWTLRLAGHRHALWALAVVSFAESSIFPVPPDALLIPMVLANPRAAWPIATVCTVASVAGGIAGYAIGALLFETVGRPVLDLYGYAESFQAFQGLYNDWGFWIVAGAGFTPFPFKVITIASGVTGLDPVTFLVAATASRAARFFLVAGLLRRYGPPMRAFIERNLGWLASAFFALLIGGFAAVRYGL